MLFNSFIFLLLFLPLVLIAFYGTRRWFSARISIGVLVAASFAFYGYWNPPYLLLLLASIVVNYVIGQKLSGNNPSLLPPRIILIVGVSLNLVLLGYFKYTNFLIDNLNTFFGFSVETQRIILPLAISFFSFQQLAYLIDCYRKIATERDFLNYCLFVSFFPQLIAGPIVHHKEMMPQFSRMAANPHWEGNIKAGITLLSIGLFKKVVLADNFAPYAGQLFDQTGDSPLHMADAWIGSFAYYFQIYFDFSGYSDMAIGIGYMFGIILPINFNSPYKSTSIIDFWRRWHMTLSRFLKDYLYIGLGGNRKGKSRRHINLLATMLLGGLWHGAAWTFVVWGGLHGLYLIINHAWRSACSHYGLSHLTDKTAYKTAGVILTTIAVLLAWVYFRSTDIDAANRVILAMFGFGEAGLSSGYGKFIAHNGFSTFIGLVSEQSAFQLTALVTIMIATQLFILLTPNAAQLLQIIEGTSALRWSPNWLWAAGCGLMLSASFVGMFGFSEFIYFQF